MVQKNLPLLSESSPGIEPAIPHLQYEPSPANQALHKRRADILADLVARAIASGPQSMSDSRVLDVGCGRGELISALASRGIPVEGIDIDRRCVAASSKHGKCQLGGVDDILSLYGRDSFDLIVLSHVLEHLTNPVDAVDVLKAASRRWLLFAVPNPMCPLAIYKSIRRRHWSNPTHVVTWDRSHFHVFLRSVAGLEIIEETGDFVEIFHGRIRNALYRRGLDSTMAMIEQKMLMALLPYFSTSVIALCNIPQD